MSDGRLNQPLMTVAESLWGFVPGAVDRYFFLRYPIGRVYHGAILSWLVSSVVVTIFFGIVYYRQQHAMEHFVLKRILQSCASSSRLINMSL